MAEPLRALDEPVSLVIAPDRVVLRCAGGERVVEARALLAAPGAPGFLGDDVALAYAAVLVANEQVSRLSALAEAVTALAAAVGSLRAAAPADPDALMDKAMERALSMMQRLGMAPGAGGRG